MNHAQAKAPLQVESAMQAVYQFLREQGFVSTAEMLAEESSIADQSIALETAPSTLLTALSYYENAREMAFAVKQPDAALQNILTWLQSLRDTPELYATRQLRVLKTHTANIICCKFQPKADSQLYAAGSVDKTVAICDVGSNSVLRRVQVSGPVLALHFNPARPNLLLATCMNGGHTIVDVEETDESAAVLQTLVEHKKYVVAGRWSPDGNLYVTGSHDFSVQLYGPGDSPNTWKQLGRIEFAQNVEAVEWVDASSFYVAVREDNYLHHLQYADGALKEIGVCNVNEYGDEHVSFNVLDMALSPVDGGKTLLLATDRHRVILLQTGTSHQLRNFYNLPNDGYSTPRLAWSPTGKYAYVTCQDRTIGVLDIAAGKIAHRLTGHESNVRDVAVQAAVVGGANAPARVLTCSFDKTCRVWTPEIE